MAVHHGNKTPEERERLVKEFREGKHSFLITTDVLSRGLDVPQVNFVINYDVPFAADDFVHRSGRAGRVHRKGIAITFTDNEPGNTTEDLKKILDLFPASFEYITLEASNKARLQEEILKIQLEAQ